MANVYSEEKLINKILLVTGTISLINSHFIWISGKKGYRNISKILTYIDWKLETNISKPKKLPD